jgi:ankyrin repeat protein
VKATRTDWEEAARRGDVEALTTAIREGVDVNALDRYGQTALMLAAARGHLPAVRVLVEAGAALDARAKFGLTAIMLAVVNEHLQVARVLASAGADLGVKGTGPPGFAGKSAGDLARERGLHELVAQFDSVETNRLDRA